MSSLNDCLGDKGREVVEEVGVKIESFRLLINKESRSWQEFFAVLKPPQPNLKHIEQRMMTNLIHYRVNYIVIHLGVYILQILFHPIMLMALLSVLVFSFWSLFILKKPVVLGDSGVSINDNGVKMLTAGISILFLSVMGSLEQLLWGAIYAIVLCGLHMLLRPRSVTSKTNRIYEEMLVRGSGGFLNMRGELGGLSGGDDKTDSAHAAHAMEAGVANSLLGTPSQQPLIASGILGGPKKD